MPLQLIVGLGNPGAQYALTRHNVGFMMVDTLADMYGLGPSQRREEALVRQGMVGKTPVTFLKPLTFMNLSGRAVASFARFYKIPLEDILVIHDDLDRAFGKIRIRQNGGAGGHNGLRSIDQSLGNTYWRLKIGIGHPGHATLVTPHVLGNFSKEEQENLARLLGVCADQFSLMIEKKFTDFSTEVARLL